MSDLPEKSEKTPASSIKGSGIEKGNRKLRLGMVGGGRGAFIGSIHRMAARLDDRFQLVAGALSSDKDNAKASALDLSINSERAYLSYSEMLEAERRRPDPIDVVSIVTPNHLHFEISKAFLEAGIHVICDKPMTVSLDEAIELVRIVRQSGLADLILARINGDSADPMSCDLPTVVDGARGLKFITACVESSRCGGVWTNASLDDL